MAKLKLNAVHQLDCREGLAQMPDESIDLVVTSPPYDDLRTYNKSSSFNLEVFKEVADILFPKMVPGGVIVWNVNDQTIKGNETGTSFRQALYFKDIGFNLHDTMIYEKHSSAYPAGVAKSVRYTQIFEYCFVLSKGRPQAINLIADKPNSWAGHSNWGINTNRVPDGRLVVGKKKPPPIRKFGVRNNIWRINCGGGFGQEFKESYKHPATMPQELARDMIKSWSDKGHLVCDPFAGSGTTLREAKKLGRKYLGFEVDKNYCQLADELLGRTKVELV